MFDEDDKYTESIPDVGEIWMRLFDHRPFLNGEIKLFLHEFEEKRKDHEIEHLFSALEITTDIKETHIPRAIIASECHLLSLKHSLDDALKTCDNVFSGEHEELLNDALKEKRDKRKLDWENFVGDMNNRCKLLDITFEEKEEELNEFYSDLEKKLNIQV